MPLSYQNNTGDNSTDTFSIPFTYTATSEISVTVDGVAQTGLSFPSTSTVQLTSAPASGTVVQVRRTTDLSSRAIDFASGSVLTEEDLDNSNIQIFHSSQEAVDLTADSVNLGQDDKWDMQSKVVKNVADPTAAQDAATKNYIENTWLSTADKTVINNVNSNLTTITNVNTNLPTITSVNNNETNINNASANATLAQNYATETDSEVTGTTDDSAKSWAIGGDETNYNMRTNGKGSAKEWAVYTTGTANNSEYSAKEYAVGTQTAQSLGSAKQWAVGGGTGFTTSEKVAGNLYSAKYYAEQAAASKTEFSNVYHGAAATDPTEDPDESALEAGDLYFNTSTNTLKYYNGSSWASIEATDTSSFATKGVAIAMAIAL